MSPGGGGPTGSRWAGCRRGEIDRWTEREREAAQRPRRPRARPSRRGAPPAELTQLRRALGGARARARAARRGAPAHAGRRGRVWQDAAGARERGGSRSERFPDGAWWVELAALEDRGAAGEHRRRPRWGCASARAEPPLEVLREHLRERRALLVLDNCEHLLEACATLVDTLLRSCPGLVVLATSREALARAGRADLPRAVPRRAGGVRIAAGCRAIRCGAAVRRPRGPGTTRASR